MVAVLDTVRAELARWIGRHREVGRLSPLVRRVDQVLYRLTHGRLTVVRLGGLPSLVLVTTGRRSGLPRTTPLLYLPYHGDYVVTGSNWGKPRHPAWTENLLANPEATVNVRGRDIPVRARLLVGEERERVWPALVEAWPAYPDYAARSGRELRVFRLSRR